MNRGVECGFCNDTGKVSNPLLSPRDRAWLMGIYNETPESPAKEALKGEIWADCPACKDGRSE